MPFRIIREDITHVPADAIVNTANSLPKYAGETDAAIYRAAGAGELLEERKKIGRIHPGEAAATPAFALPAKYIIHTVGPVWRGGIFGEWSCLRRCYENSLKLARELKCESIAFPLISAGVYRFPKMGALETAVRVFEEFERTSDSDMEIILVLLDEEAFALSGKLFTGVRTYLEKHYDPDSGQERTEEVSAEPERDAWRPEKQRQEARRWEALMLEDEECIEEEYTEEEYTEEESCASPALSDLQGPSGSHAPAGFHPPAGAHALTGAHTSSGSHTPADFHAPAGSNVPPGSYAGPGSPRPAASKAPHALKASRSLDEWISHIEETWQESLLRLIDEKGYTDTEVYKRANIDRKLFSKIRSNREYRPKKSTAVAFALALRLSLDETTDLLARAGYALSPSSCFDMIIRFFIEQGEYDTYIINLALFEHEQPLLGA